jgi:CHAT domain-containing protein
LLPGEFRDEHFQQADLIHLSMPAVIDLRDPQQSSFELSGNDIEPGRTSLRSVDIRSQKLRADLVFLSATGVREKPSSAFTAQPGLVSDFIDAGAHSVIARLWATPGGTSEAFIIDFYHQFETTGNIADSLLAAKRQSLKQNRVNGLYDWAGYQVFIN